MNDQSFYITLVSNRSTHLYPDNTTSCFTSHLPRTFTLQGEWVVGLCEINFPNGFLHINQGEGFVSIDPENEIKNFTTYINHGVYPNTEGVIWSLNENKDLKKHFQFNYDGQTRFVKIEKICKSTVCVEHKLYMSKKLLSILGFFNARHGIKFSETNFSQTGHTPASIIRGLPSVLYIHCDICSPHIVGHSLKQILRMVPFNSDDYKYGANFSTTFQPYYFPVLHQSFESISIDIKDEHGHSISFAFEPLNITLHFKRVD